MINTRKYRVHITCYWIQYGNQRRRKIKKNVTEVRDNDKTIYATLDQLEESDFYDADSDSGISSLYETIREICS